MYDAGWDTGLGFDGACDVLRAWLRSEIARRMADRRGELEHESREAALLCDRPIAVAISRRLTSTARERSVS